MLLKNTYKNIIPLSSQVEALDLQHIYTKSKPKKKKLTCCYEFLELPLPSNDQYFFSKKYFNIFFGVWITKVAVTI
jgi:hypothetical protein